MATKPMELVFLAFACVIAFSAAPLSLYYGPQSGFGTLAFILATGGTTSSVQLPLPAVLCMCAMCMALTGYLCWGGYVFVALCVWPSAICGLGPCVLGRVQPDHNLFAVSAAACVPIVLQMANVYQR